MALPASNRSFLPCSGVLFCFGALGALMLPVSSHAQDSHGTSVLVLKDPTPRPPDLEKVYGSSGANATAAPAPKPSSMVFVQRKALIVRASHQVSSLAAVLQKAVEANSPPVSQAQEVQIAGLIELLAGDVHTAAEPAGPGRETAKQRGGTTETRSEPNVSETLSSQTAELVALARELEEGVEKLGPDTLPVSVLTKSSQVVQLAHILKARLSAL